MSRDVLLSLNPQWFWPIMAGLKTIEVRKLAPLQKHPYKVYLYCTKGGENVYRAGIIGSDIQSYLMNGTVCGEFTCTGTTEYGPSLCGIPGGTYLTAKQLYKYMGAGKKLCFMAIKDPVLYDTPLSLKDFGLKHPPLSWRYIDEKDKRF